MRNSPKINALDIEAAELGSTLSDDGTKSKTSCFLRYFGKGIFLDATVSYSWIWGNTVVQYRHDGKLDLPCRRN